MKVNVHRSHNIFFFTVAVLQWSHFRGCHQSATCLLCCMDVIVLTFCSSSQEPESGRRAARCQRQELCRVPHCQQKIQQQPLLLVFPCSKSKLRLRLSSIMGFSHYTVTLLSALQFGRWESREKVLDKFLELSFSQHVITNFSVCIWSAAVGEWQLWWQTLFWVEGQFFFRPRSCKKYEVILWNLSCFCRSNKSVTTCRICILHLSVIKSHAIFMTLYERSVL